MDRIVDGAWSELDHLLGPRFSRAETDRREHAASTSWIAPQLPDAVAWPASEEEVVEIVDACGRYHIPIIGFGAGTSLEGSVNAPNGGLAVDFRKMNALLEVHREDLDCVVQPGIVHQELNQQLAPHGLFFSVDPASRATTKYPPAFSNSAPSIPSIGCSG